MLSLLRAYYITHDYLHFDTQRTYLHRLLVLTSCNELKRIYQYQSFEFQIKK